MAEANNETTVYRVYKRRFIIYAMLTLQIGTPIFGFTQYTSIANLVAKYYEVGYNSINFTALICNICNLLLFYPVGKCVEKYGLHFSLTLCAACNAFAAALKVISCQRSSFWLVYVAQCFHAVPAIMSMALIPVISMNWFPPHEVAFVMGFSIACTTLGLVIPFIFPSTVFKDAVTINEIGNGLLGVNITFAVITLVAFVSTVFLVREKPPTPPCGSSAFYEETSDQNQSMCFIIKDRNVFLLLIYHTLEFALYQTIMITLNQSITSAFENSNVAVTIAGVLINVSGIPGSMIVGAIIRKYPKYKMVLVTLNFILLASLFLYLISLYVHNLAALYIAMFVLSFANLGIQSFSMDFLLEVSYPNPGGILFAVVTAVGTLPSIIFAPLVTALINKYGSAAGNYVAIVVAILAILSTIFVKENLRRREANQETTPLLSSPSTSNNSK